MSDREDRPSGVVTTIAAKCRRCFNCVRSCPAKAIRVQGGQAYVLEERCIGCGNCIKVCAQNAKQVESAEPVVRELLDGPRETVAILAPSYPAAYTDISAGPVVAAVRAAGFDVVMEVGFGAEMVARQYARLLRRPPDHPVISTPCPALVTYVQKHMPELVPNLAPIVSPMIAQGRAVKQKLHPGAGVVFIGPCIAKKAELREPPVAGAVDAAMTFPELEELLESMGIDMAGMRPSEADPPLPHFGALFPVSGGLLKAAAITADLMDDSIAVVEGADRCIAALQELREGQFPAKFLDALLCEGCIAGPAFGCEMAPMVRKGLVTEHVRHLQTTARQLGRGLREVAGVDLSRTFEPMDTGLGMPTETEIADVLARTNKFGPEDELNCGACGYRTCREKAIAVCQGLAEPEMCLPYLIDELQVNLERLTRSREELAKAREVAMRAQQLASMGQLAADIAHEISNPLGNIVVFAQLLRDNFTEEDTRREDVATVIAEALHCRQVMASLQGFARQREPQWERAQIADIANQAVTEIRPRLAFADVNIQPLFSDGLPPIQADPAQLAQVIVNVLTNSVEACEEGGVITVESRLSADEGQVELAIRDNGRGIDPDLLPRVFQPFVTSKPTRGAGLGLAVAHGVVLAHGGEIRIDGRPGKGTEVLISIPADTSPQQSHEAAKVLIVDDDPDFLEQHRIMLSGMGFDVVTAERSDEALEVTDREIPDAFVLDMMMERTDSGARLARSLRRDPRFRHAPIILLTSVVQETGFEFQRNPKEVLEWMKADAWFDKPAPIAELTNTILRLLDGAGRQEGEAPADATGAES